MMIDYVEETVPEKFFHGTTDLFHVSHLYPPMETGVLRENFRNKFLDKVFVTPYEDVAKRYAVKAARKFGGKPVVYQVTPNGTLIEVANREYICDDASIVGVAH